VFSVVRPQKFEFDFSGQIALGSEPPMMATGL